MLHLLWKLFCKSGNVTSAADRRMNAKAARFYKVYKLDVSLKNTQFVESRGLILGKVYYNIFNAWKQVDKNFIKYFV